jgi:hypothetical protein
LSLRDDRKSLTIAQGRYLNLQNQRVIDAATIRIADRFKRFDLQRA